VPCALHNGQHNIQPCSACLMSAWILEVRGVTVSGQEQWQHCSNAVLFDCALEGVLLQCCDGFVL
jgi:hypothetical protein